MSVWLECVCVCVCAHTVFQLEAGAVPCLGVSAHLHGTLGVLWTKPARLSPPQRHPSLA